MKKIFKKNLLANIMLVVYQLPVLPISFAYTDPRYEVVRPDFHISTALVSLLYFPFFSFLVLLTYHIHERIVLKRKMALIEKEYGKLYEQYGIYVRNSEKNRYWRHDINNHLTVMESMLESLDEEANSMRRNLKRVVSETGEAILESKKNDIVCYSGNALTDTLLMVKKSLADEKKIQMDIRTEPLKNTFVSDYDLIALLSNLLDNAMEATEKLDENERKITFYMYEKNGYLCVDVNNSVSEGTDPVKRGFDTTKTDRNQHGLGTYIIRSVVRKYKGYEKTVTDGNIFRYFAALKTEGESNAG
ncbi:MAG: GHKL domain-containing protein [Lachnospiraceae bacterium]|nr:GHKL domain-containing protein [Lachnospiraceae bacterium]